MSSKSVTLEDFIKNYKKTEKKPKSYSEWLNEQGNQPDFSDEIAEAQKEYDRKKASYGKRGEALSSRGLLGSGYAAYLDANAYSELQSTRRGIDEKRDLHELQKRKGYADYLSRENEKTEALGEKVLKNIIEYKAGDSSAAHLLGLMAGLDPESAKAIAEAGSSVVKYTEGIMDSEQKRAILYQTIDRRLSGNEAFAFAIACGMNEDDAQKIVDATDKLYGSLFSALFSSDDEK